MDNKYLLMVDVQTKMELTMELEDMHQSYKHHIGSTKVTSAEETGSGAHLLPAKQVGPGPAMILEAACAASYGSRPWSRSSVRRRPRLALGSASGRSSRQGGRRRWRRQPRHHRHFLRSRVSSGRPRRSRRLAGATSCCWQDLQGPCLAGDHPPLGRKRSSSVR